MHQDVINDARNGRLETSITNDVGKSNIPLSEIIKREEGKAEFMLIHNFITLTHSRTYSFLARLIEDYNRNWFECEGFNLNEAFKSQTAKVNADWQIHETSITDEYNSKRKQLCKVVFTHSTHYFPSYFPSHLQDENHISSNASSKTSSPDGLDSRWQHPEKQKTLIHTAPVLSPSKKE